MLKSTNRPFILRAVLLAAAACTGAVSAAEPAWSPLSLDTSVNEATAARYMQDSDARRAELGYLYALSPFVHLRQRFEFVRNFTTYMPERGNPFGQFFLLREPTDARTPDVMPNHDTLYGATYLELGPSPVVLSVPDVPGRYYSVALLDAYFYNFAYVGSRTTGQRAGRYLVAGPGWKGDVPPGITGVIRAPTNSVAVFQRIYFRDREDVAAVQAIQDGIRIVPLARHLDPGAPVPLPELAPVLEMDTSRVSDPAAMLALANRYMGLNPPPGEDGALIGHFAPVGIGPGLAVPVDAAGLQAIEAGAVLARQTLTALALSGQPVRNGWQVPLPGVARRGGPGGMALQAMLQLRSMGLNVPEEAVYYTAYSDAAGEPLRAARRYTITFPPGSLPPVVRERFGFWSVTLYHRHDYRLADNPAAKYVVRSGDPLVFGADGSLTVLLQAAPPDDPALRANWLPTPASGEFVLSLRIYLGEDDVVSGSYTPPPMVPVP